MRAVTLAEFGPPEKLVVGEVPEPVPGPGQALVDVQIASITYVETQVRAGRPPHPAMTPKLPIVLGNGVGGIVASVGSGTDPTLVGRRIITTTGGSGGYAERAIVDAAGLIDVAEKLTLTDAVALLADGRTALSLIRAAAPRRGETVLIEAAAGGVGSLLVQLARNSGARVVAAAGGTRKVAVAKDLGADLAVDYSAPGWADTIGTVDLVFDGVGGAIGETAFALLRDGGRFSQYGMASGSFTQLPDDEVAKRGIEVIRGTPLSPEQQRELTRAALTHAADGTLKPLIGQTFPLERAADAHAAIAARDTIGKTLLLVEAR